MMLTEQKPIPYSSSTLGPPIQYLKGVGPQKAELLSKVGIQTVADALSYFPRSHQDRRTLPLNKVVPGERIACSVQVISVEFRQVGKQLGQAKALVRDSSATLPAVWFKRLSYNYDVFSALKRDVKEGARLALF